MVVNRRRGLVLVTVSAVASTTLPSLNFVASARLPEAVPSQRLSSSPSSSRHAADAENDLSRRGFFGCASCVAAAAAFPWVACAASSSSGAGLQNIIRKEDEEMKRAADVVKQSRELKAEAVADEAQEESMRGGVDLPGEAKLEEKEKVLLKKLKDDEVLLKQEEDALEIDLAELRTVSEKDLVQKQVDEVLEEEAEIESWRIQIIKEEKKIEDSIDRMRRHRAPLVSEFGTVIATVRKAFS
eukprot:TRINITY_DN64271_c0_g1_i1.p1 TRINITY_DN64271_c0_g1~~TRINITY_DN64271_c0_g1_i1.p1  ORF type:complete len:242 (+),score=65.90 TRINITY_DN64271_c0_g1_i1:53-778(+)